MENVVGCAVVASAIFMSFAVALGLEWLSLVVLMKFMPVSTSSLRPSSVPELRPRDGMGRKVA